MTHAGHDFVRPVARSFPVLKPKVRCEVERLPNDGASPTTEARCTFALAASFAEKYDAPATHRPTE